MANKTLAKKLASAALIAVVVAGPMTLLSGCEHFKPAKSDKRGCGGKGGCKGKKACKGKSNCKGSSSM